MEKVETIGMFTKVFNKYKREKTMNKKQTVIFILKLILELTVLILLVLVIIHLVKSENGILAKIDKGNASEKLDTAIKIFSSTDGMKLEIALRAIEGLNSLEANEETGEYNIKIDGQDFLVISRELVPEEKSIEVKEVTEGEKNGKKN